MTHAVKKFHNTTIVDFPDLTLDLTEYSCGLGYPKPDDTRQIVGVSFRDENCLTLLKEMKTKLLEEYSKIQDPDIKPPMMIEDQNEFNAIIGPESNVVGRKGYLGKLSLRPRLVYNHFTKTSDIEYIIVRLETQTWTDSYNLF